MLLYLHRVPSCPRAPAVARSAPSHATDLPAPALVCAFPAPFLHLAADPCSGATAYAPPLSGQSAARRMRARGTPPDGRLVSTGLREQQQWAAHANSRTTLGQAGGPARRPGFRALACGASVPLFGFHCGMHLEAAPTDARRIWGRAHGRYIIPIAELVTRHHSLFPDSTASLSPARKPTPPTRPPVQPPLFANHSPRFFSPRAP